MKVEPMVVPMVGLKVGLKGFLMVETKVDKREKYLE